MGAGAPLVLAAIVIVELPGGVLVDVAIVSETVTGDEEVGFTVLDGEKLQVAPDGNPLLQISITAPLNDPEAVTWNVIGCEVFGRFTVTLPGDGAPRPKSTTCRVTGASCVTVFESEPMP